MTQPLLSGRVSEDTEKEVRRLVKTAGGTVADFVRVAISNEISRRHGIKEIKDPRLADVAENVAKGQERVVQMLARTERQVHALAQLVEVLAEQNAVMAAALGVPETATKKALAATRAIKAIR